MSRFACKIPFVLTGGIFLFSLLAIFLVYVNQRRVLEYLSLSIENPSANLLIVEGWVNNNVLEQAYEEYTDHSYMNIVTTGYAYTDGWLMGSGGRLSLVVTPGIENSPDSIYRVFVAARGTKAGGKFAHFVVYADSNYMGEAFAKRSKSTFAFQSRLVAPPDSIHIFFDNDFVDGNSDRNLFFYSIQINDSCFPVKDDRTICYGYHQNRLVEVSRASTGPAENAAKYLIRKGIPESDILAVTTSRRIKSKTFTMALDVKENLNRLFPGSNLSFTIISQGIHARRSFISYNKAFDRSATIGVLAVPEKSTDARLLDQRSNKFRVVMKEAIGVLFANLCL